MLDIQRLDEVRGNNVIIYSIKNLLEKRTYPTFSIMSGYMGVGKSTVAKLVAKELNKSDVPVHTFNFGMDIDMKELETQVFKLNPIEPRAFIFEELHGLNRSQQTALLTMLDSQPQNVYIICTTTEIYKVLRTIRSRATVWEFKLLGNKQLAQLLDDYLAINHIKSIDKAAKTALIQSARGVPRDLLKNTDLAIAGSFSGEQLSGLLGNISDNLVYTVFCSLKATSIDFVTAIDTLLEQTSYNKVAQLRDFWTRYLLESKGLDNATISKDRIIQLQNLYTNEEAIKIGRTLIRATEETLALELSILNMELTHISPANQVGQQKDRKAHNTSRGASSAPKLPDDRYESSKLTRDSLKNLKLGK